MADSIITYETFNIDNLFFEEPKQFTMKNDKSSGSGLKFSRVYPKYRYPNGQVDKIYIQTPELFSWGVQENMSMENPDQIASYTFSFVMFDQNRGPTEEEQKTIKIFEDILDAIKKYLKKQETKESLGQFELDPLVDMMELFYRKKDKGVIVEGLPPTLYPKLQTKFEKVKGNNPPEIITDFRNMEDDPVNPKEQMGVRCKAVGNTLIDNIFIGSKKKPSIQLKLDEVVITEQFKKVSRLRLPQKVKQNGAATMQQMMMSDDEDDGNTKSSSPKPEEAPAKTVTKIKRRVN